MDMSINLILLSKWSGNNIVNSIHLHYAHHSESVQPLRFSLADCSIGNTIPIQLTIDGASASQTPMPKNLDCLLIKSTSRFWIKSHRGQMPGLGYFQPWVSGAKRKGIRWPSYWILKLRLGISKNNAALVSGKYSFKYFILTSFNEYRLTTNHLIPHSTIRVVDGLGVFKNIILIVQAPYHYFFAGHDSSSFFLPFLYPASFSITIQFVLILKKYFPIQDSCQICQCKAKGENPLAKRIFLCVLSAIRKLIALLT